MFWFQKHHSDVIYGDKRTETHILCDGRALRIEPDIELDFTALPFADKTFQLVAFDPPHLERAGPNSWMAAKYGKLFSNWKVDLATGFQECLRVLKPGGVLVFKWNETQIKVSEILKLAPQQPLFGNTSGKRAGTHWMVFMKEAS